MDQILLILKPPWGELSRLLVQQKSGQNEGKTTILQGKGGRGAALTPYLQFLTNSYDRSGALMFLAIINRASVPYEIEADQLGYGGYYADRSSSKTLNLLARRENGLTKNTEKNTCNCRQHMLLLN